MSEAVAQPATRLWLVRHGRIEANRSGHWHGSTDSPLDEIGRRQARAVGDALAGGRTRFTALYSSPLQRTRATADAIAGATGLAVQEESALREWGIGELEGTAFTTLHAEHGFFERILHEPHWAPSDGESLQAVVERIGTGLTRIADAHRGEDVIVVSHGAALALHLGTALHGVASAWRDYHVDNCSVSVLEHAASGRAGTPTLLSFNDVDHLAAADA